MKDNSFSIAIVAVPFSSNVGDGVIAECLRWGILHTHPDTSVELVDLAMRHSYAQETQNEGGLKSVFGRLPSWTQPIFSFLYFGLLKKYKLRRFFSQAVNNKDAIILGGGNIISDIALNFPLKIEALSSTSKQPEKRIALHGVGIADKWSVFGKHIMRKSLRRLEPISITVRDEASAANGRRHLFAAEAQVPVTWDPGILAALVWPRADRPTSRTRIGLGVISAQAIKLDGNQAGLHPLTVENYIEIAIHLVNSGFDVLLFCNGAPEDAKWLGHIEPILKQRGIEGVSVAPSPRTPEDLAATIAGNDAIIANRLHAIIVAHAFGIPTVALEWDPKVRAFMEKIDRSAYSIASGLQNPETVISLTRAALANGVSELNLQKARSETLNDIGTMVSALSSSHSISKYNYF